MASPGLIGWPFNGTAMYYGEKFNSISHLIGAVSAATGSILLIVLAARLGDPWKIVSFSIYGAMLLSLYVSSTLYHSVRGKA
jgi:hemolysin III